MIETHYNEFVREMKMQLQNTLDRNIIIYGANRGGEFVRWFYHYYFGKTVKTVIDRWKISPIATIPHLFSLYHLYEENDLIVNVTPSSIINDFNETGDSWEKVQYQPLQILDLWSALFGEWEGAEKKDRQITYYDWLESKYGVDFLNTIKRKYVSGFGAHGYYPTDFRFFVDALSEYKIQEEDAVMDIGCGKGSSVLAFAAFGFSKLGAVEYTDSIYEVLNSNYDKLGIGHENVEIGTEVGRGSVTFYHGDAADLNTELDRYNWFFLFNPFSWEVTEKVIQKICESMNRHQRKIYILYAEPIGHKIILDTGKFTVKKKICNDYAEVTYHTYLYESL